MTISNKLFQTFLFTTLYFILMGSSCRKEGTSCLSSRVTYNFQVPLNLYNDQANFQIGDTIFIESVFAKQLIELTSNNIIDFSNAVSIGGDIGINIIDTVAKKLSGARNNFLTVDVDGKFLPYQGNDLNRGLNTSYIENENNYYFKGGLICKKKGIYAFGISDLISPGLNGKRCTKAGFSVQFQNFNQNIDLYTYATGVTPDFNNRIFCFRVQ